MMLLRDIKQAAPYRNCIMLICYLCNYIALPNKNITTKTSLFCTHTGYFSYGNGTYSSYKVHYSVVASTLKVCKKAVTNTHTFTYHLL